MNIEHQFPKGLSESEAQKNLLHHGYNELPSSKPRNLWAIALGVVREPMFLLLVSCGVLYLLLGDLLEGLLLLGFVFVIMGIEFYQERKTEKALDALRDLASPRALVLRDGRERRIAGREVVPDDIIILQEGDRVPADATVLSSISLLVDESLLTGESVPVRKIDWDNQQGKVQPGGDDLPFVYSGTLVVQGNGMAWVTATGINTEIGKIGKALEVVPAEDMKMKREMGTLIRRLAIIGTLLCLLVVALYTLSRGDMLKGFLAGLTLAMALLPEEFPVVLAVFLALGAWRMAKKSVLTRRPAAIEALGSATVLCSDKTGTLTQNEMTATWLYKGAEFFSLAASGDFPENFHEIIEYGILSSQTNPFDPMERAILRLSERHLAGTEHIHRDWEMLKEYPLSRELLAMSRVFKQTGTDEKIIAVKGAPEAIFDLCHLDAGQQHEWAKAVEHLAGKGLRVLGVGKASVGTSDLPEIQHDFAFRFVGLIGLSDPIRPNVPEAVAECLRAGVRVIMITGDYPVTAMNIAREIGLPNCDTCISGQELHDISEEELAEKIRQVNVFARVVPEQKLKIVNALKKNREIVAMTGDGVNDAPALKAAHIGIAMGEKGTDVAREASSLVLMDDNFASIVGAIKMGRRICDNLQKALGYIFAIHVPIAGLSLIPVFFADLPLILWPVHIVFLELIIDPACSIIFEAEQAEATVMSRPPASMDEPFFGTRKIFLSCMQGVGVLLVVLAVYGFGLSSGYAEKEVRAFSFITLIAANIAVILSNRSWSRNIFQILASPNPTVKWVVGSAILFLALVLEVPFLTQVFLFQQVDGLEIVLCAAAGASSILGFELFKLAGKFSPSISRHS